MVDNGGEVQAGGAVQEAISRIYRSFSRDSMRRRMLGNQGSKLSPTDVGLLESIWAREPIRLSDLATCQGVDKSTITPRVRRLESADLVDRRPDPSDGRAALVSLSKGGAELLKRFSMTGTGLFDELLESWSTTDQRRLGVLLRRLADDVEAMADRERL